VQRFRVANLENVASLDANNVCLVTFLEDLTAYSVPQSCQAAQNAKGAINAQHALTRNFSRLSQTSQDASASQLTRICLLEQMAAARALMIIIYRRRVASSVIS